MNPLTQQQINQYQWQVADGVARIPNGPVFSVDWNNKEHDLSNIEYFTNAPDGTYSGEAFEAVWQIQPYGKNAWYDTSEDEIEPIFDIGRTDKVRLSLRLKRSHLPAVLTTEPGEEWKDRYSEVWFIQSSVDGSWSISKFQPGSDYADTYDWFASRQILKTKREWHLITPPAEQESETVEQAADKEVYHLKPDTYLGQKFREYFKHGASWQLQHLQSTLTQKYQRIAELEREWISVAIKEPELDSTIMIADLIMGGVSIMDYDSRDLLQYFKYWMPLPTPPQH